MLVHWARDKSPSILLPSFLVTHYSIGGGHLPSTDIDTRTPPHHRPPFTHASFTASHHRTVGLPGSWFAPIEGEQEVEGTIVILGRDRRRYQDFGERNLRDGEL